MERHTEAKRFEGVQMEAETHRDKGGTDRKGEEQTEKQTEKGSQMPRRSAEGRRRMPRNAPRGPGESKQSQGRVW